MWLVSNIVKLLAKDSKICYIYEGWYYSHDKYRFINADTVAGQIANAITLNRFAYANGNPISFVDPFGLSSTKIKSATPEWELLGFKIPRLNLYLHKQGYLFMKKAVGCIAQSVGCVVIVIILIFCSFFALHLGIAIWAQLHIEGPAEPEIQYAEFPFTLTYEINGEQITVEDVYVCELEYCGFDINAGQQRIWKGYIKSTEERNLTVVEFKEGSYQCRIFCSLGSPKVYMGDSENMPSFSC